MSFSFVTGSLHRAVERHKVTKVKKLLSSGKYQVNCTDNKGKTPLHVACSKGYFDLVRVLVSHGADFTAKDKDNDTPLTLAAKNSKFSCLFSIVKTCDCNVNIRGSCGRTLLHFVCAVGNINLLHILVRDCKADLSIVSDNKDTPLMTAAKNDQYEVLKSLVHDYGCDPNTKDSSGKSLLHFACANGKINLVHVLLRDCKAGLDVISDDNDTPLMTAAKNNQYEVLKSLVHDYGCDPNAKDYNGKSLLHIACAEGNVELVHVLIQHCKAKLNIADDDTPLMIAVKNNQYKVLKSLVCDYGCSPNFNYFNGKSLLHIACADGNIDLVHVLVRDCKANLNIKDKLGDTPLQTAFKNSRPKVLISLVCDYGCDPNVTDSIGGSLLHCACADGNIDMIHVLVKDCKADLDVRDDINRYTPLHIACANGNRDLVHVLVQDCKADLNVRDYNHHTPLMTAVENERYDLVKPLVCDYGCDPNACNKYNRTILHDACEKGNISLVRLLVQECKADLDVRSCTNDTPLTIAAKNEHYGVWKLLVCDYGCDPDVTDSNGRSLLHFACANGDVGLVHVLVQNCKINLSIRDNLENTPLMTAVKSNSCEVVKVLVSEYKCDISITDVRGRSLLHIAGGVEVLNLLIGEYKMSASLVDDDGNTPLHLFLLGCESYHLLCAEILMFDFHAPIYVRNKAGETPKDLAKTSKMQSLLKRYKNDSGKEIQDDYKSMQQLATKKYSGSNFTSRVFVVGHPGAGKSSLVEALKRETIRRKSFSRVSQKSVLPHTAGIVPSTYVSDNYGRVQFYDFAGDSEYYSSHAAILERMLFSNTSANICIIVLNLLDDVEIENKYLFWLNFINYSFKALNKLPPVLVVGSHFDQLSDQEKVKKERYIDYLICDKYKRKDRYFSLDCCSPRSSNMNSLRHHIDDLSKISQPYCLSLEEKILLGLLEKDFSNVTACTAQTIASHIKSLNLSLPRSVSLLHPLLQKLQAIGVLLLLGDKEEEDYYIVLNVAQLTNEVHKKLFSKDAFYNSLGLASFNIGLLTESLLEQILPKYITKECLIQLQYCQEVSHLEIDSDSAVSPSLAGPDISTSAQNYLFFPALCNVDKKDISWQTPPENSCSIGWLARCRHSKDFFPPRFLHVLLLRIALRFTLVACGEVSPDHTALKRRCEMWNTGVHWLSVEGVECEVEVINSKEVVVSLQSLVEPKTCFTVFNSIVNCVMEAKAEFCDFIALECFLLDKVSCLIDDNLFSLKDVDRVLTEGNSNVVQSVNGKNILKCSKLLHIHSSFWSSLFPIDEHSVLNHIKPIVKEWFELGLNLELSSPILKAIETNHPRDVIRCKTEMVTTWLCSSSLPHPPCWWSLVKALQEAGKETCANNITKNKGEHIELQKKLLDSQGDHLTPDEVFLESFAEVVGAKWPYLASLLSLTSSTIEEVRREGRGLPQREYALLMLHKWVCKKEATYSQLYRKLKPVSLFQYCK